MSDRTSDRSNNGGEGQIDPTLEQQAKEAERLQELARQRQWEAEQRARRRREAFEQLFKVAIVVLGALTVYTLASLLWSHLLTHVTGITYEAGFFSTLGLFGLHTVLTIVGVVMAYGLLIGARIIDHDSRRAGYQAILLLNVPSIAINAGALLLLGVWFPGSLVVGGFWDAVVFSLLVAAVANVVTVTIFCLEEIS